MDYQQSLYYGVFYPCTAENTINSILASDPDFADLAGDDEEALIGKALLVCNANSDIIDRATMCYVFADDMTIEGPTLGDPDLTFMNVNPDDMIARERKYADAVAAVKEVYDLLTRELKKRKQTVSLYRGWRVVNNTWDDSSDSAPDLVVAPVVTAPITSPITIPTPNVVSVTPKVRAARVKKETAPVDTIEGAVKQTNTQASTQAKPTRSRGANKARD